MICEVLRNALLVKIVALVLLMAFPSAQAGAEWEAKLAEALPLSRSGGYSRHKWREMAQRVREIPPDQLPLAAVSLREKADRQPFGAVFVRVLETWAETDPMAALTWVTAGEFAPAKRRMFAQIAFRVWAERDWKQASEWLQKFPDASLRYDLETELIQAVASDEPAVAFDMFKSSPGRLNQGEGAWHFFSQFAMDNPEEAAKAWASLPESEARKQGVRPVASAWASQDSDEAWKWANALGNASERKAAREAVFGRLVDTDPEKAANLFTELSAPGDFAPGTLARNWAGRDSHKAVEWAETLPERERDMALVTIIDELAKSNPAGAMAVTSKITNTQGRAASRLRVAQRWFAVAPDEAVSWMEKEKMTEDFISRVRGESGKTSN
jgi:hypothetical protein